MKLVKIIGIILVAVIVVIAVSAFALFGGLQGAGAGPSLGEGIDRVQAGFSTAYVLDGRDEMSTETKLQWPRRTN